MFGSRQVCALAVLLLISGCQTTNTVRIDNVPMYGQPEVVRPDPLRQADEAFVSEAEKGFSTRREASNAWFRQAESFMEERNLDLAMRRYNQSWLLDPTNFRAYWGFGRVLLEQENFEAAVEQFETSVSLLDDPKYDVALLVDAATAYAYAAENDAEQGNRGRAAAYFKKANDTYAEAVGKNAENGNIYRRWAIALFLEKRYAEAWKNVALARKYRARPLPESFLRALSKKVPEPR